MLGTDVVMEKTNTTSYKERVRKMTMEEWFHRSALQKTRKGSRVTVSHVSQPLKNFPEGQISQRALGVLKDPHPKSATSLS